MDDAQLSADPFRSFLRNYRSLFKSLGTANLVFVTTSQHRFWVGQKALNRFWKRGQESATPAFDLKRLLAHFPHRLLYENRQTQSLDTAQIKALAEDLHELRGTHIDHLFATWKQSGAGGLRAAHEAHLEDSKPPRVNLMPCLLDHSYDLFETLHAAL